MTMMIVKSADTVCNSDGNDDFSQLCELLTKSNLVKALSTGEWTIFAPNKNALKGIEWDTYVDDQIKDVLLFHTVKGTSINGTDLSCSGKIEMGNGDDSRTKCRNDNTYQTGPGNLGMDSMPQIIYPDISACNGVIHVLDGVMLPKLSKTKPTMTENGDYLDPGKKFETVIL